MALTKARNIMIEGAPVNVKDYGAVGDGVTDDTAAFQAAITAVGSSSEHKTLYIPYASYVLNSTLTITSMNIKGDGATLICNAAIAFSGSTMSRRSIKGLRFEGNGGSSSVGTNTCLRLDFFDCVLESLYFVGFDKAIDIEASLLTSFKNVQMRNNEIGVNFQDGSTYHNGNTFDTCWFRFHDTAAVVIKGSSSYGIFGLFTGCAFDSNEIGIDTTKPVQVLSGYFEGNEKGINLVSTTLVIDNSYFLRLSSVINAAIYADSSFISARGEIRLQDGHKVQLFNNSTMHGDAEWTTYNYTADSTSQYINAREVVENYNETPTRAVEEYAFVDIGTSAESLGARKAAPITMIHFKAVTGERLYVRFGMWVDSGTYRMKSLDTTAFTLTHINNLNFSISGFDSHTYTFTISSSSGALSVSADSTVTGTTRIKIQQFGNLSI